MYKLKIQLLGIINVVKHNFNFVFIIHVLVIPSCLTHRETLIISCIPDIIVAEQKVCRFYVGQSLAFHFVP